MSVLMHEWWHVSCAVCGQGQSVRWYGDRDRDPLAAMRAHVVARHPEQVRECPRRPLPFGPLRHDEGDRLLVSVNSTDPSRPIPSAFAPSLF